MMGQDDKATKHNTQHCAQTPELCYDIGFIEPIWGQAMCDLIWSMKQLRANDWANIMKACALHLGCFYSAREESEDKYYPDRCYDRSRLHASIQIDW